MPAQSPPLAPIRVRERHFFAREFERRSGRIIALCRFVLATVFFIALWLAPDQPARSSTTGYVMLFGYMLLFSAVLMIAWRNWWWDQRLAWPMRVLDVALFLAAVYFTETDNDGFTSPFLAFFAQGLLSRPDTYLWIGACLAARQIFRTIVVRYPQPRTGAGPSPKDPLPTWARAGT